MNISVSAAPSVSPAALFSCLPGTEHFPGILQVKVQANMRSSFFRNIDREYIMQFGL